MAKSKNELVVQDVAEIGEINDLFGGGFTSLPRLEISCGNSACCQDGTLPVGKLYLKDGDDIVPLGDDVKCIVLAVRAKAMAFEPNLRIVYDQKHEEYMKIQEEAKAEENGASFGPEFILYSEENGFFTFYLKSTTNKKRGKALMKHMGAGAVIKVDQCKNDKFTWFSFKAIADAKSYDLPEDANDVVGNFRNAENVLNTD